MMAYMGKIPHALPVPGLKKAIMFPDKEEKLRQVVAACPKRTITAEQTFSTQQALKLAKKKELPLCLADIQNKLNKITAGKQPWPAGLKRDELDPRKRWILPKSFVDSLLADAEARKRLPEMLREGLVVPLSKLATQLGLKERSLHPREDIRKIRIGTGLFVLKGEAERFKKAYAEGKKQPKVRKPGMPAAMGKRIAIKGEGFDAGMFKRIEQMQALPAGDARKGAIEKKLALQIAQREQWLLEQKKKLLDRMEMHWVKTVSSIKENNINIGLLRVEIFRHLLAGGKITDKAIQPNIAEIKGIQANNEVLQRMLKKQK